MYRANKGIINWIETLRRLDPDFAFQLQPNPPWGLLYCHTGGLGSETHVPDLVAPTLKLGKEQAQEAAMSAFAGQAVPPDLRSDCSVNAGFVPDQFWWGHYGWAGNFLICQNRCGMQEYYVGDLAHLTDADRELLGYFMRTHRAELDCFQNPTRILGDNTRGEVYGYANYGPSKGFVCLRNPSWDWRDLDLGLADVGWTWPTTPEAAFLFPSRGRLRARVCEGRLRLRMAPWATVWMELRPAGGADGNPEYGLEPAQTRPVRQSLSVSLVPAPADASPRVTELEYRPSPFAGATYGGWLHLPREWDGFPLRICTEQQPGHLYVANRPMHNRDEDPFVLFIPRTSPYRVFRFGGATHLYFATGSAEPSHSHWDVPAPEPRPPVRLEALAYYHCRFLPPTNCHPDDKLVVILRFMRDGKPFTVDSMDTRWAQCAFVSEGRELEHWRAPQLMPSCYVKPAWCVFECDAASMPAPTDVYIPRLVDCDYHVEAFTCRYCHPH